MTEVACDCAAKGCDTTAFLQAIDICIGCTFGGWIGDAIEQGIESPLTYPPEKLSVSNALVQIRNPSAHEKLVSDARMHAYNECWVVIEGFCILPKTPILTSPGVCALLPKERDASEKDTHRR